VNDGGGGVELVVTLSGLIDQPTCLPKLPPAVVIDMFAKAAVPSSHVVGGGGGAAVKIAVPTLPTKLLHLTLAPSMKMCA
jgi:hypothetical protein